MKHYNKLADALTPMLKFMSSEFCNQICYDAIQVHGGTGFMKDFPVERMYRDARITSIYEGTTQLQVVAAIRAVINETYSVLIETFEKTEVPQEFERIKFELNTMKAYYEHARKSVSDMNSDEMLDLHARRLVEMAAYIIMTYLLMFDAIRCTNDTYSLKDSVHHFLRYGKAVCVGHLEYIRG
jgi:alkylation response protein AidB-like acyl-CoA dehydrogenase